MPVTAAAWTLNAMKLSRATAALRALCGLGLSADLLVPALLEALHSVVPSHRNLFDWTDDEGRLVRYFIEGPIDAQIAQLYFDEFHNRREAEAMPRFDSLQRLPPGVRSAAELEHPAFFNSALYNEIWRPQGIHTRLEAVLRGARGRLLGSLVLYRAPGERRFTREDERRLGSLLPDMAAGLQAAGPALAAERLLPSPDAAQTLLMTLQGEICHASPGAHRLLLMADGGASRTALSKPFPALADGLLGMLLARLREHTQSPVRHLLAPVPYVTHEAAAGRFVASAVLLQPTGQVQPPQSLVQVTLRRLEPHRVALERVLRALPLTPGQLSVCRGLYHGQTPAHLSQQLDVAPTTMAAQVRTLHGALDVHGTPDLRALLNARIG